MNFAAGLALISAWGLGVLLVSALRPRGRAWHEDVGLVLALGWLAGAGVTSGIFFLATLVSAQPARLAGGVELALAVGLAWWCGRRRREASTAESVSRPRPPGSWGQWVGVTLFAQAVLVASVVAWRTYRAEPYGGWDGWAIWNMHARFMVRAGTEWPALLTAPPLNWTHPDYPRLLPATVARVWAWAGNESPAAAAVVSGAFAAALLGGLVAFVARGRGRIVALAGGLLLAGTPFFVTFAANEHADLPLGAYMLATLGLVALGKRGRAEAVPRGADEAGGSRTKPAAGYVSGAWMLAGLCAGLAAWTKNEGLLFAGVSAALAGVQTARGGTRREFLAFATGLAIALVPVAVFKIGLAPRSDLVTAAWTTQLAQLFDGGRHATVLAAFGRDLGRFGEWSVLPYLAMLLPLLAWRRRRRLQPGEWVIPLGVGLMLAGYYVVYLLSPHDLNWHLGTSLVRLLLQLWSAAILAWCLIVPDVEGAGAAAGMERGGRAKPVIFAATNFLAAGLLTSGLARQLGPNELVRREGSAAVTISWGEGWYAPERHGRDRWAWSGGRATLQVHVEDGRAPAGTLRFKLRALGARRVSVSAGGRVLWQGAVAEAFVPVEIADFGAPAGTSTLEFSTDAPAVPESAAGGRALAFALYNLELIPTARGN